MNSMVPEPVRIAAVQRETPDTFTLTVEPRGRAEFKPFQPGQFSMLYAFGNAELPISISSDPAVSTELRYTIRAVGAATTCLVNSKADDWIGMRGPFGAGWPVERAVGRDVVLAAGGIGLAPLRPVLYTILRRREEFGRLTLLYGARSPTDMLYHRELSRWSRAPDTQVLTTVDYGGLEWRGHVGFVTQLLRRVRIQPARTVAMICGPEIMMRATAVELLDRGLSTLNIHLSMERNMKCGIGWCGHCQYGPYFICKDGPCFPYSKLTGWMDKYEI